MPTGQASGILPPVKENGHPHRSEVAVFSFGRRETHLRHWSVLPRPGRSHAHDQRAQGMKHLDGVALGREYVGESSVRLGCLIEIAAA